MNKKCTKYVNVIHVRFSKLFLYFLKNHFTFFATCANIIKEIACVHYFCEKIIYVHKDGMFSFRKE